MSEGIENTAPASRLPRLASPAKHLLPTLAALPQPPPLSTQVLNKRKPTTEPTIPNKRTVSSSSLTASTSTALRTSQRGVSGGFAPTTSRKPIASSSSTTSRPNSSLASSTSTRRVVAPSTSVASTRTKPVGIAATRRPPPAASANTRPGVTRATSTLGRSVGPPGSRATSRGPSPGAAAGMSAIGSGMASVAQYKSQNEEIEKVKRQMGDFQNLFAEERQKISSLQMSQVDLQALLATTQNTEREARRDLSSASEEIAALRSAHSREVDDLERQIARKDREKRSLEDELRDSRDELSREREIIRELKQSLATQSTHHLTLSAQLTASQTQCSILQAEVERCTISVSSMKAELEVGRQQARDAEARAEGKVGEIQLAADRRVAEIEEELRTAETIRRKLHNQVQELKGNIRVFARVRPALSHESSSPDALADIAYGDERTEAETGQSQITLTNKTESATGKEREQVMAFTFDKVFQPRAGQKEVFEEISMLAQSVLDGYNVCIFAYGQTGSGKSWTMEGGSNEHEVGMIPRAIDMIFRVSTGLKDRGWKYTMEGSFLEVYNEVINDLLGSGQFDSKKHEVKLDKDGKVTVTDTVSIPLNNPRQVATLLERASSRRAVAATLMNERSSRSHSVFSLKVKGVNPLTEEKCEGTLNLVDLAGSERLASSGADSNKDRMKETININKSLSALADVIGALGQGRDGGHVPYRNSMLTRLLQSSLSGSSKTLMMCNLSPLAAHLGESLCSLRFATKVNSTVVGSAKKSLSKA